MTKRLSDVQLVLLTTAGQRADGNILPPAATIAGHGLRLRKSINHLISRGLAEEHRVDRMHDIWREDEDSRIGVRLTVAGREASAVPGSEHAEGGDSGTALQSMPQVEIGGPDVRSSAGTKRGLLISMLQRDAGATLSEIMLATGWLRHSTRAALTGLRKRGHVLQRTSGDAGAAYYIASAPRGRPVVSATRRQKTR